jgi:hypothetical protein
VLLHHSQLVKKNWAPPSSDGRLIHVNTKHILKTMTAKDLNFDTSPDVCKSSVSCRLCMVM